MLLTSFPSPRFLKIDTEETAYNAVIRWVYYDEANRATHLPNLLNCVRLAIMSVRFLTDIVDNEVSRLLA